MILTLTAFLITVYFIITRTQEALNDRYLIEHGVDTKVKILSVDGDPVMKRHPRYQTSRVRISFPWHDETLTREIEMDAVDLSKPNAYLLTTTEMTLRMDPNNPDRWTEETVAKSWAQELIAVGLLLPIFLVVAIVTVIQRRMVLGIWSEGQLQRAVVVDTRHSAIAPASRIVRYALESTPAAHAQSPGQRISQTLMPVKSGIPQPGEPLWVIVSPTNSSRAIVAKLYG
jgi:hypothetical protein